MVQTRDAEAGFLPVVTRETEPFWTGCKNGQLKLPRCRACGRFHYYPRLRCPFCQGNDLEWLTCTGRGKVHTFTIVRQNANPWFKRVVPYVVAIVELDDAGIQMMTDLVKCPLEKARIGLPVKVVFEPISPDISLPRFEPAV